MSGAGRVFRRMTRRPFVLATLLVVTLAPDSWSQPVQPHLLDDRLRNAELVLVGTVRRIEPRWEENAFGDRLIVSRVRLDVQETLKGDASPVEWLEVEGGTLDGLTMQSSAFPIVRPGERAVFLLDDVGGGVHRVHGEGRGILFLDRDSRLRESGLALQEIRQRARAFRQEQR